MEGRVREGCAGHELLVLAFGVVVVDESPLSSGENHLWVWEAARAAGFFPNLLLLLLKAQERRGAR